MCWVLSRRLYCTRSINRLTVYFFPCGVVARDTVLTGTYYHHEAYSHLYASQFLSCHPQFSWKDWVGVFPSSAQDGERKTRCSLPVLDFFDECVGKIKMR